MKVEKKKFDAVLARLLKTPPMPLKSIFRKSRRKAENKLHA